MNFQTPKFNPVLHHRPEELRQGRQYVRGAVEWQGETVEFTVRLLDCHTLKRPETIGYDHPAPAFSRVFLFHGAAATYEDEDRKCELLPDRIWFLPAGRRFRLLYPCGIGQTVYHLHLADFAGRGIFTATDPLRELNDSALFATLATAATPNASPLSRLTAAMSIAEAMLADRLDVMAEQAGQMRYFSPLFNWLENLPPAQITVRDLAERMGLTPDTLSHRFRRRLGISVKQYLNDLVRQRAQEALLHSGATTAEIAFQLGFRSEKYFHRFFRLQCGETPGSYRRRKPEIS